MLWTGRAAAEDSVVVKRVGETSWILRPREALQGRTVDVLRDAFLEAADSGAQNVVLDLSDSDTVAFDGAATLVAMAELMLGRGGLLWLATRWHGRPGHTLRPIEELSYEALAGMTTALDAALAELPADAGPSPGRRGAQSTKGVRK